MRQMGFFFLLSFQHLIVFFNIGYKSFYKKGLRKPESIMSVVRFV